MAFQYTGKSEPITVSACHDYVKTRLREYDDKLANKGGDVGPSPYHNKLVMPTGNGKFVEVPVEIQDEAVRQWLANKNVNGVEPFEDSDSDEADDSDDSDDSDDGDNDDRCFHLVILLLTALGVCGFLYYKHMSM
jgi:hypothetical protein